MIPHTIAIKYANVNANANVNGSIYVSIGVNANLKTIDRVNNRILLSHHKF